jgi:ABC-type phosphate/phosphonate transport system substrate-binding protein
MDPALRTKIRAALLALRTSAEGRGILKQAKLSGFAEATDPDFDPHRRIVEAVFGEKF